MNIRLLVFLALLAIAGCASRAGVVASNLRPGYTGKIESVAVVLDSQGLPPVFADGFTQAIKARLEQRGLNVLSIQVSGLDSAPVSDPRFSSVDYVLTLTTQQDLHFSTRTQIGEVELAHGFAFTTSLNERATGQSVLKSELRVLTNAGRDLGPKHADITARALVHELDKNHLLPPPAQALSSAGSKPIAEAPAAATTVAAPSLTTAPIVEADTAQTASSPAIAAVETRPMPPSAAAAQGLPAAREADESTNTPASGLAPPPAGTWSACIASTKDDAAADNLVNKLKDGGIPASVISSEINGAVWYRVISGAFADRDSANVYVQKLIDRMRYNAIRVCDTSR